jgi:excisionase family DNA binding protein
MTPMRPEDVENLRTMDEAARYLGVSRRTLWTLAKNGQVETVMVGARRRFTERALLDYLNRNVHPAKRKPADKPAR